MTVANRDPDRLEPKLRGGYLKLSAALAELGFPIFLVEGVRSIDRQVELYAQGRTAPGPGATEIPLEDAPLSALRHGGRAWLTLGSPVTNAQAGESDHNPDLNGYSRAFDFAFDDPDPWSESHPWELAGLAVEALGLRWGGRWSSPDRPHVYTEEA